MDKATAEKMVDDFKVACLLFDPDRRDHYERIDLFAGRLIEALTHPPVVEAKPQGERRSVWCLYGPKGFVMCIPSQPWQPADVKPGFHWVKFVESGPFENEDLNNVFHANKHKLKTQPSVEAKAQGDPQGFVQCQDKGWHKDMGDHYDSECLTKEAAIGDCTEAQLDELAEKSGSLFKKKLEKAVDDHSAEWTVIEALNKVSLISIMQQAATEAKPSINTSFYAMDVFAKAIRSHFAKAANTSGETNGK